MPKWKATIKGTLRFQRSITVYAANERDAEENAKEMTMEAGQPDDTVSIKRIKIEEHSPEDPDMIWESMR